MRLEGGEQLILGGKVSEPVVLDEAGASIVRDGWSMMMLEQGELSMVRGGKSNFVVLEEGEVSKVRGGSSQVGTSVQDELSGAMGNLSQFGMALEGVVSIMRTWYQWNDVRAMR